MRMFCTKREEGLITPLQQRVGASQSCAGLTSSLTRASNQKDTSCRTFFLPPQPNPRLQSQDTSACHRAITLHLLGVGSKSSTLFPKLRPQAQHEASTAHQQPGMCYRLSGGQERGKSKQQVTLLGFVHVCVWTVNLRAALFHQGANWEEKLTVKCYCIFFPGKMEWNKMYLASLLAHD